MKKLKLELESLRVQSFETGAGRASERGTVRGHDYGEQAAEADEFTDNLTDTAWWRCFTLTCLCASDEKLCTI
jgi:hypothetical protein